MPRALAIVVLVVAGATIGAAGQARGRATGTVAGAANVQIKNGVSVRGKYVTLIAGTNGVAASPGARVSLLVQVTPGPKMHVYAPGQDGYIPVALSVGPTPAFSVKAAVFPAARPYTFAPSGEHVNVYSEPFLIRRDLVISASADLTRRAKARETLIVAGALEYQACDDTVCYRPETVPIEWKLALAVLR